MKNIQTLGIKINPETAIGGHQEVELYVNHIQSRRQEYGFKMKPDNWLKYAEDINDNGYCVIKDFFNTPKDKKMLNRIEKEFKKFQQDNNLQYNDSYTEQISHPLYQCESIVPLAFDDRIISIATHFFQCTPAITNINFRLSKSQKNFQDPNALVKLDLKQAQEAFDNLPQTAMTTCFHLDHDSVRFLKFFIYLTDVGIDNGPFTYVEGSHLHKPHDWRSNQQRRPDYEILREYGYDRVKHLTGKKGDLIIANTHGYHKGQFIKEGERLLLTIYYGCHPTEFRPTFGGKMKKSDFEKLPEDKKPLADFLNKE